MHQKKGYKVQTFHFRRWKLVFFQLIWDLVKYMTVFLSALWENGTENLGSYYLCGWWPAIVRAAINEKIFCVQWRFGRLYGKIRPWPGIIFISRFSILRVVDFDSFWQICVFSCTGSSILVTEFWTQWVTFQTWDPSDIWWERCPDKKTKKVKQRETKTQKSKKTKTKKS